MFEEISVFPPPEPQEDTRLTRPLCALNINRRAENLLSQHGVLTVGDLVQRSEAELVAIPSFGDRCLGDIKYFLMSQGLTLRQD